MKKIIKILYILLCFAFWLNTNSSYANTTGTVSLNSDKQIVEIGEEIEVTINLENAKTSAFTSYLNFDNTKLDYISGPENTNVIENRIITVWYDELGGNGAKQGGLAKFRFKSKENGIANLTISGDFYTETGQNIQTEFKELQVQIGKEETKLQKEAQQEQGTDTQTNNSNLKSLRLDLEGIIPVFNKDVFDYYIVTDKDIKEIEVLAVAENPRAIVDITGNTNIKEGENLIKILVTSEDKTKNSIYTINLTKTDNLELANTNLETLAIESVLLNPPFYTSITHYNVEISNTISDLNILAIPENEQAKVEIKGKDNLKDGNNQITIIVTAQNGFTTRKYVINAYKRNLEEEQQYFVEQKQNTEKLEQAYEIEEISNKEQETQNDLDENRKNFIPFLPIIVISIILVAFCIYKYFRKKTSNQ